MVPRMPEMDLIRVMDSDFYLITFLPLTIKTDTNCRLKQSLIKIKSGY
jgi:hypothetical protein